MNLENLLTDVVTETGVEKGIDLGYIHVFPNYSYDASNFKKDLDKEAERNYWKIKCYRSETMDDTSQKYYYLAVPPDFIRSY